MAAAYRHINAVLNNAAAAAEASQDTGLAQKQPQAEPRAGNEQQSEEGGLVRNDGFCIKNDEFCIKNE